jgi:hypothetical protein
MQSLSPMQGGQNQQQQQLQQQQQGQQGGQSTSPPPPFFIARKSSYEGESSTPSESLLGSRSRSRWTRRCHSLPTAAPLPFLARQVFIIVPSLLVRRLSSFKRVEPLRFELINTGPARGGYTTSCL